MNSILPFDELNKVHGGSQERFPDGKLVVEIDMRLIDFLLAQGAETRGLVWDTK